MNHAGCSQERLANSPPSKKNYETNQTTHRPQPRDGRGASKDFSLVNDLAAANPAKLKEMQDIFTQEAIKNRVLPLMIASSNASTP